jgi:hypothetical protein
MTAPSHNLHLQSTIILKKNITHLNSILIEIIMCKTNGQTPCVITFVVKEKIICTQYNIM